MRVSILCVEFDGAAAIDAKDFKGIDVHAAGAQLQITYVDSPIYRRLVVLALALAMAPETSFTIVSKRSIVISRQLASINDESHHIDVITKQIEWARRNPTPAADELVQMIGLLNIGENLAQEVG